VATEYVVLRATLDDDGAIGEALEALGALVGDSGGDDALSVIKDALTARAGWSEVGRTDATTDVAAIKAVAKDTSTDLSGGAVAVPARSWRPRKPERKVQEVTTWR
jgi:hypothetical protein